ncbi:hypothetical protein HKBW3S06_01191 [Candidatus Hakubella thermalkaliphila]|uniref:Type IV pilus assembly protein PilX n=1 Tax=Candidatus Hakubella thermalkaliphila TaxID=2754717 RepID=A0A6V8NNW2_9ACTN|nr:hypothetical protein [Candidatus Hakubella thermalkaliphila]GFP21965.1 hypothetical protein HKBW3S06_01191 [Candidatus Hakubella thermalkaliphila]
MAGYKIQDTGYRIKNMHCASCIVHHANEKGIALVMTLVISAIVLAVMAGLIYMITVGTQISGIQKRYKTAHEAALGGAEVAYKYIGVRGDPGISGISFLFSPGISDACRNLKLNQSTSNWAIGTTCKSMFSPPLMGEG